MDGNEEGGAGIPLVCAFFAAPGHCRALRDDEGRYRQNNSEGPGGEGYSTGVQGTTGPSPWQWVAQMRYDPAPMVTAWLVLGENPGFLCATATSASLLIHSRARLPLLTGRAPMDKQTSDNDDDVDDDESIGWDGDGHVPGHTVRSGWLCKHFARAEGR